MIAQRATGYNNIDLTEAEELDLTVARVSSYSPSSVAEFAWALALAVDRRIVRAAHRTREFDFRLDGLMGRDLHGRTAGVVGTGKIEAAFARGPWASVPGPEPETRLRRARGPHPGCPAAARAAGPAAARRRPADRAGRARAGRRVGPAACGDPAATHQPPPLRGEGHPRGHPDHTARCAARESAALLFPGPLHAETVLDLVRDAESRDVMDSGAREDLVRWTRLGPEADTAVDSVPEYAFGPRKRDGKAPVRDFAGRRPVADRGTTTFEYAPHLALLSAPGDGPADWLRAGQALERVLLEATLADLATSLTSHALRPLSCACWSATRDRARGRCRWCCVSATARGVRPPAAARSLMFSTSCSRKTASV
ncbi:hypothetical protein QFZ32_000235 [Streptomyces canus]|nr:hypothetical protein [Streptomyces canus]MDQ1064796.1 hypothetical protein [Streptomyces canus]